MILPTASRSFAVFAFKSPDPEFHPSGNSAAFNSFQPLAFSLQPSGDSVLSPQHFQLALRAHPSTFILALGGDAEELLNLYTAPAQPVLIENR